MFLKEDNKAEGVERYLYPAIKIYTELKKSLEISTQKKTQSYSKDFELESPSQATCDMTSLATVPFLNLLNVSFAFG